MASTSDTIFDFLETTSVRLFAIASVFLFITAAYRGVAYVEETISFNLLIANIVFLGRLAVILALGGLSVQIMKQNRRLGTLSRGLVVLAALFTIALFGLAVHAGLGSPLRSLQRCSVLARSSCQSQRMPSSGCRFFERVPIPA
jgi:hypothetical protein